MSSDYNDAILVTGADGFIGSHFVDYVLSETERNLVLVCSWRRGGIGRRLSDVASGHTSWPDRVFIVTHDLQAPFSTIDVNKINQFGVKDIVHFAAESHVDRSITDPSDVVRNNVLVTINALELSRKIDGLRSFFQISTDEVYGPADGSYCHKEWDPIIPSNPYSGSKAAQEAIAISYWRTYGVPLVITNTMNNIGERQSADKFVPMVIKKILNGETIDIHSIDGRVGSRFYLHATNHAHAIMSILDAPVQYPAPGRQGPFGYRPERFNVVGEQEISNLDLVEKIASRMGVPMSEVKYELVDAHSSRPGHDLRYALDGAKMSQRGWEPPMSLDESIDSIISWYTGNPEWLNVVIE